MFVLLENWKMTAAVTLRSLWSEGQHVRCSGIFVLVLSYSSKPSVEASRTHSTLHANVYVHV